MKKLLLSSLVAATLSLASLSASAATVQANFTVSVTLVGVCQVTTNNPTVAFGTYTAFQTAAATGVATGPVVLTCTRNLAAPTIAFDAPGAGAGLIAGLNYTLTSGAAVTSAGTDATGVAGSGTATTYSYTLAGNMPGSQAGQCTTAGSAAAACNGAVVTAARTVTFTY